MRRFHRPSERTPRPKLLPKSKLPRGSACPNSERQRALGRDPPRSRRPRKRAIGQDGKLALYFTIGNNEERLALHVEEEPESELLAHAVAGVQGALLRLPSGRLSAIGAEQIWQRSAASAHYVSLPAGDYAVSLHALDWSEEELERAEQKVSEIVGPEAMRADRRRTMVVGTLFALAVFGVPLAVGITTGSFWLGMLLFFGLLAFGLLGLTLSAKLGWGQTPDPVAIAEDTVADRFPSWVAVLRRLADGVPTDQLGIARLERRLSEV